MKLQVGFLDSEHQDVQSKPCRDLLASLSQHHPTALSIILREVTRNISAMGKVRQFSLYDVLHSVAAQLPDRRSDSEVIRNDRSGLVTLLWKSWLFCKVHPFKTKFSVLDL
jgi:hypothetical protein